MITTIDDLLLTGLEESSSHPVSFNNDIITISCCKHRMDKLPETVLRSLQDTHYEKNIQQCDVDLSKSIRSYYGQKLMVAVLVGEELSPYRKSLAAVLNTDGKKINQNELGLVYKLPEFYEYDLEIDELVDISIPLTKDTPAEFGVKRLTLAKRLVRKTKNTHTIDYWFNDPKKNLYLIKVEGKNSLDKLFKKLVDNKTEICFNAGYLPKIKGKLTFFDMTKWDLLLD